MIFTHPNDRHRLLACTKDAWQECLEGHADSASRLIKGIIGVILWFVGVIRILTRSPCPSKYPDEILRNSSHSLPLRLRTPGIRDGLNFWVAVKELKLSYHNGHV